MRVLAAVVVCLSIGLHASHARGQMTLGASDVSSDPSLAYDYFGGLRFDPAIPTPAATLG